MSKRPLSISQKQQLGIVSTAAWKRQSELNRIELPGDMATASKTARMKFWVHQQIAAKTQRVCTAADMIDDEYLAVRTHFEALADLTGRAFDTAHREAQGAACHREPGCAYVREMRSFMDLAGFSPGYMTVIMKAKFRGCSQLEKLTEYQLKQLHDTIVNRARAKLKKGETANRNKKQRERSEPSAAAPEGPSKQRTYVLKPSVKPLPRPPADDDGDPF